MGSNCLLDPTDLFYTFLRLHLRQNVPQNVTTTTNSARSVRSIVVLYLQVHCHFHCQNGGAAIAIASN